MYVLSKKLSTLKLYCLMKKNVFYAIIMVFAAFLATSCNRYQVKTADLGNDLTAFTIQDPAVPNGDLWGIRGTKSGVTIAKNIYSAQPEIIEGFLIGKKKAGGIDLMDATGKVVANALTCEFATSVANPQLMYFDLGGDKGKAAYLIKEKKLIGPKAQIRVADTQVYYQTEETCGVLSFDNKDLLPEGQKELIIVIESKVKGTGKKATTTETLYYIANDGKAWTIYKDDGTKLKAVPAWNLKKYTKNAEKSDLEKISFTKVAAI